MRTLDQMLVPPFMSDLVPPDPNSFVPLKYQTIGDHYLLNDMGVHRFDADLGDLVVTDVYPIPFVAIQGEGDVRLHFFLPTGEVETHVLLDYQMTAAFRSLKTAAKDRVDRYISTCLLAGVA